MIMASGQDDKSFQETNESSLKDDSGKEVEEQDEAECEITLEDEGLLTDDEKQVVYAFYTIQKCPAENYS